VGWRIFGVAYVAGLPVEKNTHYPYTQWIFRICNMFLVECFSGEFIMKRTINIGILGEFNPAKVSHAKTVSAVEHAAAHLSLIAKITWIPTPSLLTEAGQKNMMGFDCLWASPGSPYESIEGALKGIQIARELNKPFLGN
jgi:CTP synthase (UTP-ammonia lyase)